MPPKNQELSKNRATMKNRAWRESLDTEGKDKYNKGNRFRVAKSRALKKLKNDLVYQNASSEEKVSMEARVIADLQDER